MALIRPKVPLRYSDGRDQLVVWPDDEDIPEGWEKAKVVKDDGREA